tara:strand:- start:27340 stop:28617 length:1278 start_codon:yes stop_codon:yes gene_type:complete
MKRLGIVILLVCALTIKLKAQNLVRLCVGGNHNFGVSSTVGSIYNWTLQDTAIAAIISGNGTEQISIDLNNPGLFQLLVEEIDVKGCTGYDSVLVEVLSLPKPNIFSYGSISFCEGDSVRFQVDSVYTSHTWNTGEVSQSIFVDTTGEYYIEVTDANGCIGVSPSIFTQQKPRVNVEFDINGSCEKSFVVFTDLSSIPSGFISDRIWYLGDETSSSSDIVSHVYQHDGDYIIKLVVLSDLGCLDSLSKSITIFKNPIVDFSYNPYTISTLEPEINFSNLSINSIYSLWDFGDSTFSAIESPTHIYNDPGIYNVMLTVTDTNQCIDSISKQVIMYYDFVLHMPTAFTPNGDGNNDTFGPAGLRMSKYKAYDFYIYNRWGEIIFQTDDINDFWDGLDSPSGLYNWLLIITDELGELRKENGVVTLIK